MLKASTLKFLKDLDKNNNKPWFDANRSRYEEAKADFSSFVQKVIDQHGKKDAGIKNLVAKDTLFRINRDVRFSKNKAPYKNNMGASINKGGKKSNFSAGYYIHLQPGAAFTGGGIWMPEPNDLKKVRQEIDYNLKSFTKLLTAPAFRKVYKDLSRDKEYLLSRVPKGYEADNPAAEYLKFKSYVAMVPLTDADLTGPNLVKKVVTAFAALQPLIEFVNQSISDEH